MRGKSQLYRQFCQFLKPADPTQSYYVAGFEPALRVLLFRRGFFEVFESGEGFVGDLPLAQDFVDDAG